MCWAAPGREQALEKTGLEGGRGSWVGGVLVLSSGCSEVIIWDWSSVQLSKCCLRPFRELLPMERPVPTWEGCVIVGQAPCPGYKPLILSMVLAVELTAELG